ncbi:histidine phosphatase family protein [Crenobacter luteus]|uniref:Phosphoglycerate mutase n=1 Tax=Crenobacter luteus TaxID=1452487 RepID=A0A161SBA6_9NEIS|nr:histidine phosphatase family protein [Crenobacter luteus]KZE33233.1 phosphoglycerate mutase [Crenobacter luteus]
MNPYTLTLLRHGEIDHDGRLIGRTDLPLNEQGWAQLRDSWRAIVDTAPVTALATSPLARCRAFALEQALAAGLALKVDVRFAECDFGDWDGAMVDALSASTPDWNARLVAGALDAPGGETLEQFRTRVLEGLAQWMAEARGSHRVLVAHAGVIAVVLAELLDTSFTSARLIAVPRGGFVQLSMLDGHPAYLTRLAGPNA